MKIAFINTEFKTRVVVKRTIIINKEKQKLLTLKHMLWHYVTVHNAVFSNLKNGAHTQPHMHIRMSRGMHHQRGGTAPEQHTSSPATRAMEQLPPLNYSPPVNCHVNIHLQQGERCSRWPAWK